MGILASCLEPECPIFECNETLEMLDLSPNSLYYALLCFPSHYSMPHLKEINLRIEVLAGALNSVHMSQKESMPSRFRKHWDTSNINFTARIKPTTKLNNGTENCNIQQGCIVIFPISLVDLGLNNPNLADIEIVPVNKDLVSNAKELSSPKHDEFDNYILPNSNSSNKSIANVIAPKNDDDNATALSSKLKAPALYYIAFRTSDAISTSIEITTSYVPRVAGLREPAETVAYRERQVREREQQFKIAREAAKQLAKEQAILAEKLAAEKLITDALDAERLAREMELKKIADEKALKARKKRNAESRKQKQMLESIKTVVQNETLKIRDMVRPKNDIELAVQSKMKELVDYASTNENLPLKSNMQLAKVNSHPVFALNTIAENPEAYINYQQQMQQLQFEQAQQEQMQVIANYNMQMMTYNPEPQQQFYPAPFSLSNQNILRAPNTLPPLKNKKSALI